MHKQGLIKLLSKALTLVGDVKFDNGKSMLGIVEDFDLHHPLCCNIITEVNAISFAAQEANVLPFVVYRKKETKQLLITDIDGEVGFNSVSNATALLYTVKAIENIFGATLESSPICNEDALVKKYQEYMSGYAIGELVSPIERCQEILYQGLVVEVENLLKLKRNAVPGPEADLSADDQYEEDHEADFNATPSDEKSEPSGDATPGDLNPFKIG